MYVSIKSGMDVQHFDADKKGSRGRRDSPRNTETDDNGNFSANMARAPNLYRFNSRNTWKENLNSNNFIKQDFLRDLLNNDGAHILSVILTDVKSYSEAIDLIAFENNEFIILITKIISKVCETTFLANKSKILQITLKQNFFKSLNRYISTWIFEDRGLSDFRQGFELFLLSLMTIFEIALDLIPSVIWDSISKSVTLIDIDLLLIKDEKHYEFSDQIKKKLISLKEFMLEHEKKFNKDANKMEDKELEPVDDFRYMNLYPSTNELVVPERNFMRKNKITGSYDNVKHYLDVQFRLLREDFMNPVREDITDYINGNKRTLFNIKVHKNVNILERAVAKEQCCFTVQITSNKKTIELLNSKQNTKRFMNGGLLLFTDDNFNTIICGKIVDKILPAGQVVVSFIRKPKINSVYLMIECMIFFEPYYQVLKVLQQLPQNYLPMENYIINVQTSIKPPKYLLNEKLNFQSFQNVLNDSQIESLRGALSQEFIIIQGPPGTGKTYLGLKITMVILRLTRLWFSQGPILVICYTNHALDQFLEKLLEITPRIVRLGTQTKSEALKKHSLREIKKKYDRKPEDRKSRTYFQRLVDDLYREVCNTKDNISTNKKVLQEINNTAGIVRLSEIKICRQRIKLDGSYFEDMEDEEFVSWLLEESVCSNNQSLDVQYENYEKMMEIYGTYFCNYTRNIFALTLRNLEDLAVIQEQSENIDELNDEYEFIAKKIKYLKLCLDKDYEDPQLEFVDLENPFNMPAKSRWQLYKSWLKDLQRHYLDNLNDLIFEYQNAYIRYNEISEILDVKVMRRMQIVGMTTTCAARMHSTIKKLESPIIIIEEAAEILEAHILPALTEHCQHLILIGDHKQLKPSTSDYVVDKKYNLGTSLFERMVANNVPFHILNVQHRMRPEISSLICPSIYPELEDDKSVKMFPPILGIDKPLYFVDHLEVEQAFGDSSKMNIHEAKFIIKLAEYLLNNGYASGEITVLAAYTGQVFILEKERDKSTHSSIRHINIKALDNFQGEENKIILLSLVRSNPDNKIGFLSLENRVCVALSRAREGLYIIGNMTQLCKSSEIWQKVNNTLISQNAIGRFLPLRCHNHKDTVTLVRFSEDFANVPEGGCTILCEATLKCGHNCTRYCHINDLSHDMFKCQKPCERSICGNKDHKCRKRCYEKCGNCEILGSQTIACGHIQPVPCCIKIDDFKCMELVSTELSCGHTVKKLCHIDANKFNCCELVTTKLSCGHTVEKPCYIDAKKFKCSIPCEAILLNCSHPCILTCHINKDPEHIKYICEQQCEKNNIDCKEPDNKHKCLHLCYEPCHKCTVQIRKNCKTCLRSCSINCYQRNEELSGCKKPCVKKLSCYHKCSKRCYEPCGPCTKTIFKPAECGHSVKTKCGQNPDPKNCRKPCEKILNCGHKCRRACNEKCDQAVCFERCSKTFECGHTCIKMCGKPCACKREIIPKCGHFIQIMCNETPKEENCSYSCKRLLNCGHKCRNLCNELCTINCQERCNKILQCEHLCSKYCHEICVCEENCK